ncbi:hypothetical protein HJFPF1_11681 [Paramyrothecium foliicola]|nr:hypothetical protein HJFPF1_11681 [Paramyrothecium foliicola]
MNSPGEELFTEPHPSRHVHLPMRYLFTIAALVATGSALPLMPLTTTAKLFHPTEQTLYGFAPKPVQQNGFLDWKEAIETSNKMVPQVKVPQASVVGNLGGAYRKANLAASADQQSSSEIRGDTK